MINQEFETNHELIFAVREIVESQGFDFEIFLEAYRAKNQDLELTEQDLVHEILEAGEYQAEDGAPLEDTVIIGMSAIGEDLGLFGT